MAVVGRSESGSRRAAARKEESTALINGIDAAGRPSIACPCTWSSSGESGAMVAKKAVFAL